MAMKKLPEDEWIELDRMSETDNQGRLAVTALTDRYSLSPCSSSL